MAAETVKEFLAKIGFSVDEASERKFNTSLVGAVTSANLLANAIEKMAGVVATKVAEAADNFEKLYYQAKNVGAAANEIKAFQLAIQQWGGSFEGAGRALDSFGDKFRNLKPAADAFLRGTLGIQTSINGVKRSTTDVFFDAAKVLATKPPWMQKMFSDTFGVDMETLRAAERTGAEADYEKYLKSQQTAGIDPRAYEKMAEYERAVRDMWNRIGIIADGAEVKLGEAMVGPMEKFGAWLAENEPAIDRGIGQITDAVGKMTAAFEDDFTKVHWADDTNQILSFAHGVAQFVDSIHGFVVSMEDLNERSKSWWITRFLNGLAGGVSLAPTPPDEQATGAGIGGWWRRNMPGWLGGGPAASGGGNRGKGPINVNAAYDLIKKAGGTDEEARVLAAISQPESGGNPGSHNTKGMDDSYGLWQINMLGNLGPARLAHFGLKSDEDLYDPATNARVALQMHRESKGGGYDDWSTYRSGAYQQYLPLKRPFAPPGMFRPASAAHPDGEVFDPGTGRVIYPAPVPYVAPTQDPNAAALARASQIDTSKTVTVGATTNTIHVYGAGDPHAAAAMVGLHLDRNAHDLTSNLQGAVQ
jgi:hypothetical protein